MGKRRRQRSTYFSRAPGRAWGEQAAAAAEAAEAAGRPEVGDARTAARRCEQQLERGVGRCLAGSLPTSRQEAEPWATAGMGG